jgi:hypothetical protein
MQAKYLERQSNTRSAGAGEAVLREAAGRAKVVITHRALFAHRIEYRYYKRSLHIDKRLSNYIRLFGRSLLPAFR